MEWLSEHLSTWHTAINDDTLLALIVGGVIGTLIATAIITILGKWRAVLAIPAAVILVLVSFLEHLHKWMNLRVTLSRYNAAALALVCAALAYAARFWSWPIWAAMILIFAGILLWLRQGKPKRTEPMVIPPTHDISELRDLPTQDVGVLIFVARFDGELVSLDDIGQKYGWGNTMTRTTVSKLVSRGYLHKKDSPSGMECVVLSPFTESVAIKYHWVS